MFEEKNKAGSGRSWFSDVWLVQLPQDKEAFNLSVPRFVSALLNKLGQGSRLGHTE